MKAQEAKLVKIMKKAAKELKEELFPTRKDNLTDLSELVQNTPIADDNNDGQVYSNDGSVVTLDQPRTTTKEQS